jgi:hypothetical protein
VRLRRREPAPGAPLDPRPSSRSGASFGVSVSVIASVTRTAPEAVVKVVSRTFVPSSYRRSASNGSSGQSSKTPPRSASRSRPKTDGESTFGRQSQSIEPSSATRAAVRPSPIAA